MKTYDSIIFFISFAGLFISTVTGLVYVLFYTLYKRPLKYAWLFACIAGFCFCTVDIHLMFSIAYGDPSAPNYETYKNWNLYRFILNDIICLLIWLGIGWFNYLAFIKHSKIIRYLIIVGAGIAFVFIVTSVTSSIKIR